jgi:hypothetical protein
VSGFERAIHFCSVFGAGGMLLAQRDCFDATASRGVLCRYSLLLSNIPDDADEEGLKEICR